VRREVLTVVFGRSGLGKSSLLRAGLFPVLREEQFLPIPIRLDFSPEAGSLVDQVRELIAEELKTYEVEAPAIGNDETLWEYFHRAQLWNGRNRLVMPLLVFDQFEEIFTLGQNDPRVQPFLVELSDLIENRIPAKVRERLTQIGEELSFSYERRNFHVIICLREDFLAYLEDLRPLLPSISLNHFRLNQMNGSQALDAILRPGGDLVDEEVARQILAFIAGGRSRTEAELTPKDLEKLEVEPTLLSLFCRELNQKRLARGLPAITADLVTGERRGILSGFYERSVADLPMMVQTFIEERLLTAAGYRRSEPLEEALSFGVTKGALQKLVDRRLLRLEKRFGTSQIELIHDRLKDVIVERRRVRRLRERQRHQRSRRVYLGSAAGAVALTIAIVSVLWLNWKHEELHRRQAESIMKLVLIDLHDQLSKIGKLDLLETAQNGMLDYFKKLPAHENSKETQYYHGVAYHNRGDVYLEKGKSREALADFRKALGIFEELQTADPGDLEASHQIGVTRFHIARVLRQQGRLSASLDLLKDSFHVLQGVLARKPGDAKVQESFQACYTELGATSLRLGRCDEGKRYLLDAVKVAETPAAQAPEELATRLNLADSYILLANAELSDGEIQTADKDFSKAANLLAQIRRPDEAAQNLGFKREELALKLGRGSLFLAEGKAADASTAYDEALQLQRDVRLLIDNSASLATAAMLEIRIALFQAALAEGNLVLAASTHSDALERAKRLTKSNPDNSEWRYSLAVVTSLAGELQDAQNHQELAAASYQQALAILDDLAKKSPEDVSLQRALAWNHYLKGLADRDPASANHEWTQARTVIETVTLSSKVHDADVQDVHARVLIALGQPERARPICADLSGKGWNWHGFQSLCRSAEGRPGGTKLAALR
jgi:tetratricopeptide (TPR) repeat protein